MQGQAAINLDVAAYRRPVKVDFQNISYSIRSPKGKPNKRILCGLSGKFESGKLVGILGSSGAGKTSLLNVLSGFKLSGVTGSISYNDQPLDSSTRKMCCHITQESEMMENLTTLETMNCGANLKLGRNIPVNVRLKIISDILNLLGLDSCINTRVKSLSGGELKRLSIAVEMITNPPVMFFDEPTSGLDSSSSLQVMSLLCELAKAGRTIVCTIHQPSSRILELIDVVYLVSKGECLYNGPLDQMVSHFEGANFHCPAHYNRADFALEVANNERYGDYEKLLKLGRSEGSDCNKDVMITRNGVDDKHHDPDREQEELHEMHPMVVTVDKGIRETIQKVIPREYNVSFLEQVIILIGRSLTNSSRSLLYCRLRVVATAIVGMLLGSIFWQIGANADHIVTNASCLYFFLLFTLFSNAMSTVVTFPFERKVFLREHMNNWYSIGAYVTSKIIASLPLQLICPTIFISIAYFMTGQPHEMNRFLLLWLVLILVAVMADSLGLLVGAACDIQLGTFAVCSIFIPNLLYSGFFIKYSELPGAYQWLYSLSFLRYGFEGAMNAIFAFDRENLICEKSFCLFTRPEKFLKMMEMDGGLYWVDVIGLISWTVSLWFLLYLTVKIRLRLAQ